MSDDGEITVVVATRNRRDRLCTTLRHLVSLPDAPAVVVVDNGSTDGTSDAVRGDFPEVDVIALPDNRGAAGRTAGVQAAETEAVAFCDDDSWWAPGSLRRAAHHLTRYPRVALLAARILVGPDERLDPTSEVMSLSPLTSSRPLPGPAILGFVACGAVVRRRAYLQVGGFSEILHWACEERLLALDLAALGWDLAYAPDLVAHHHPVTTGGDPHRRSLTLRNDLLIEWLRRPLTRALLSTVGLTREAIHDPIARRALVAALRKAPSTLLDRRALPADVENRLRQLERTADLGLTARRSRSAA